MSDGLGSYIKRARGDTQQKAIADAAGLTKSHLSAIESGKIAFPSADIRRRIAKALGVSHLDLLIAAGELAEDEVRQAGVDGVVERDPSDGREAIIERIRALPWNEGTERGLEIALGVLETK